MNERRMGALLGYALLVVSAGVAFFFTPFLIGQLGKVQYGLYAIVGSLAAYFMLLDLGLNDTVVRYIVRYRREADEAGLANFMAIMLGVYACIALALVAIGAGVYAALPRIFGAAMSPAEVDLLRQMFLIVLAGGALTIALNPFSGVLVAHERFVLVRGLDIVLQVLSAAAAVAVLLAGFEAVGLVLATTVVALAAVLFKTGYALARLGVKVRFTGIPPGLMREVAAYAAPIFVVVVVELIYWRLDNIIIGSMLGAAAVALYAVAISFQKHFQRLAGAITRVMYPRIVQAIEGGISDTDLTQLMVRISRAQAVVLLPVLVGMVVFGREFLNLWLGPDFEAAYPIMLITMLPYALELIGSGRNMVLQVKGLYWIRAGMTLALSLLNVAVTVALIPYLGIIGAAIGTGLGAGLGAAAMTVLLHVRGGVDGPRMLAGVGRGLAPAAVVCLGLGLLVNLAPVSGWGGLFAKGAVFMLLCAGVIWVLGLNAGERNDVRGMLRLRPA